MKCLQKNSNFCLKDLSLAFRSIQKYIFSSKTFLKAINLCLEIYKIFSSKLWVIVLKVIKSDSIQWKHRMTAFLIRSLLLWKKILTRNALILCLQLEAKGCLLEGVFASLWLIRCAIKLDVNVILIEFLVSILVWWRPQPKRRRDRSVAMRSQCLSVFAFRAIHSYDTKIN